MASFVSPQGASGLTPYTTADDCRLSVDNSILLVLSHIEGLQELTEKFYGTVISDLSTLAEVELAHKTVYLCGDTSRVGSLVDSAARVFIIRELSHNFDDIDLSRDWPVVDEVRMPLNVHGVGVYYRRFFDPETDLFNMVRSQHVFQALTESNKPGTAHRTGIYLTPVEKRGEDAHFRLLRCSSNLSGPTGNFRSHDEQIVDSLNIESGSIFENQAPLNHVLAQIYRNTPSVDGKKATKAKIKDHSDKTKDMPHNGLMAFVTFYDKEDLHELEQLDQGGLDYGIYGRNGEGQSALTKLNFRLKKCVWEGDPNCALPRQFSITLYPNSVFFMPLSTNRLYTHEIQPSFLDARLIPTRMGYVVRCSDAEAVHRDGHTYMLQKDRSLHKLQPPTQEGMSDLRRLYAEENHHDGVVDYGDVPFSMNQGDYLKPLMYNLEDDFRWHSVPEIAGKNMFAELMSSVKFEKVGKGRLGAVLVDSNVTRGTPIVRTTTKYTTPAREFQPVHTELAKKIKEIASLPFDLNNALIENYTNEYATMGFHSDQAQDLEDHSHIAVYSCYKYPEKKLCTSRKLIIESKEPNGKIFELPLEHNSVVVFSTDSNKRFKHKIVLEHSAHPDKDQEWLGVTLRTSKSFVKYTEKGALWEDNSPLAVADEGQTKAFYKLRRLENEHIDFTYPDIKYSISESDLMCPDNNTW
jgi:hypothetical protein